MPKSGRASARAQRRAATRPPTPSATCDRPTSRGISCATSGAPTRSPPTELTDRLTDRFKTLRLSRCSGPRRARLRRPPARSANPPSHSFTPPLGRPLAGAPLRLCPRGPALSPPGRRTRADPPRAASISRPHVTVVGSSWAPLLPLRRRRRPAQSGHGSSLDRHAPWRTPHQHKETHPSKTRARRSPGDLQGVLHLSSAPRPRPSPGSLGLRLPV
mmetsp:Transcript_26252/g.105027  ORF Transcript_26252/g.105027 Transcript_26252/m.105027 type:complete len:216 (-) Transcript_26252:51-698(-)